MYLSRLQLKPTLLIGALVIVLATLLSMFISHNASAGREVNSRLQYGNTGSYCATGANRAYGMVWISNYNPDYYSEVVTVSGNATSVPVQIRGALNNCSSRLNDAGGEVWAAGVSSRSANLSISGDRFWRGNITRYATYEWTYGHDNTADWRSHLDGTLRISGPRAPALCSAANAGTTVSGTVSVSVYRYLEWRQFYGGSWHVTTGGPGEEPVDIAVRRVCPLNFQLTPSITTDPSVGDPGTSVRVTPNVNNTGTTGSSNATFEVRTFTLAPGAATPSFVASPNNRNPTTQFPGSTAVTPAVGGSRSFPTGATPFNAFNQSVPDLPIGTRICYTLSVNPYRHDNGNWAHSAPACVTISKSPKVQVLGGDLRSGWSIGGAASSASGRVITSNSANATGVYGSWGEYALMTAGSIRSMTSGSGSVGGNQTNVNLLTFANSAVPAGTCGTALGCYVRGGSMPNVGSRFSTSSSSPVVASGSLTNVAKGLYRSGNALNIGTSTIAGGKWIVINAPNANVTISGDINYAAGPYRNASELPQLVIIANNITIAAGVRNIDAWLIAPGTYSGATVTGGVIRTCDVAPSAISSGVCQNPLTINGPVMANRLLMLRTGGSEPGVRAGDPAEVFNFRPDAYFWALQQGVSSGRITTVSTTELPPRY